MVCSEFPRLIGGVEILYQPIIDKFGLVDAHDRKMDVAVVKGIVLGAPALGAVERIGIGKLGVEEFRRLGIVSALLGGEILLEAPVIVVAAAHHIGQVLHNALHAFVHGVPLYLMLAAVGVIARGEDEFNVGVLLEHVLEEFIEGGIIGL